MSRKVTKGVYTKAAKQAFKDIRQDKSMWVHFYIEVIGVEVLAPHILNESILNTEK